MSTIEGGAHTDRPVQPAAVAEALAAIVNSSGDAVIAKTVEGIITAWNDGAAALYRRSAEQMIGCSIEAMIPPEALVDERARHARVAGGVAESGYRCRRLAGDGRALEVVMSMSPVRDAAGGIVGVASISREVSVTERDDSRFASLLEAAPDAILCVDPRGAIVTVNAQVTRMFGYGRDELLGAELEMLMPERVRQAHTRLRSEFLAAPQIRTMGAGLLLSGRRRDGTVFPVEVSLAPDHSGAETLVIAAIRDVTEQRMVEREARESESRLRQLAESVNTVFILRQIDPPAYLYVSPGSRAVLGVEPEDFTDGASWLMVHPDDRDRVGLDYLTKVRAGLPAQSEHRIVTPDGELRWVRSLSSPVPNPHGPPERHVITVENISEQVDAANALREAEAAASTANAAKNQFLSRMSHELRTPLNAVLGFGQLLELQLDGTDHAEAVGQILKGGRHLLHLIDDILDIARIEAGETSISTEPVPVEAVVEEAMQLMAPLADAASVVLMRAAHAIDCSVRADRQRLRQVLLNLLSNAVKYNRRGGRVWVERTVDDPVTITVHDDGPGIAPGLQSRLFTPFDRLGAETSGVDGTGIGLALTRSLVELMKGSLSVDSAPGRGSAFTVTLPRAEQGAGGTTTIVGDDRGPALGARPTVAPCTLLYIEDNQPNVQVLEHVVRMRPAWKLIHAGLGRLGVELAEAHLPDLVLLDLHLPDESGEDVLRRLKTNPATSDLPVVILTADATVGQSRRLVDSGAAKYLTKPLDVTELLALLDDHAALRVGTT